MKSSKYLLAAGALLALVASPALAYEAGTWVLRAGVGVVAPDSDNLVVDDGTTRITINVDDGTSLTLMGTYMFTRNWGFDIHGYPVYAVIDDQVVRVRSNHADAGTKYPGAGFIGQCG